MLKLKDTVLIFCLDFFFIFVKTFRSRCWFWRWELKPKTRDTVKTTIISICLLTFQGEVFFCNCPATTILVKSWKRNAPSVVLFFSVWTYSADETHFFDEFWMDRALYAKMVLVETRQWRDNGFIVKNEDWIFS